MTARKTDQTPEPPGGRAAERLREFEEARRVRPPAGKPPVEETPPDERPATGADQKDTPPRRGA